MLVIKHLSCFRNDRLLFSDLNVTVSPGEILHLQGENGAGKSSLLQILAGLLLPETGEVLWKGESIHITADYKHALFYLGHKSGVKAGLTVAENLQFSASLMGKEKIPDLMHFRLTSLLHLPGYLLSAGQRQRVALTRLLITDATLWILDEPFNAIDQENVQALTDLFQRHLASGGMIIFTSHQSLHLPGIQQKQLSLSGREAP